MRQRLADGKRSIISYSGSCRHLIDMDRHNVRLYLTYNILRNFLGAGDSTPESRLTWSSVFCQTASTS
jgi:hypothetical protein